PESTVPGGLLYRCGDNSAFLLFPSGGTPSGTHTQIGFTVLDIETEVTDLKSRGVTFEEYNHPDYKTTNSITTSSNARSAWFKDSEGNLLGIVQYL
ncbi:MAG: VOC family protein, partial [Chloroflexia bacterium]